MARSDDDSIIPKVRLTIQSDNLDCEWTCPSCGWINQVYLFSELLKDARAEMYAIENVTCPNCNRKFDTSS